MCSRSACRERVRGRGGEPEHGHRPFARPLEVVGAHEDAVCEDPVLATGGVVVADRTPREADDRRGRVGHRDIRRGRRRGVDGQRDRQLVALRGLPGPCVARPHDERVRPAGDHVPPIGMAHGRPLPCHAYFFSCSDSVAMLEPARRSGDGAEALAGLLDGLQHPSRQVTSEGELEEMAGDSPACWDGRVGGETHDAEG
jgi:hypothetical protein